MIKIFKIIRNVFSVVGFISCFGIIVYFWLKMPIFGEDANKEFNRIKSPNQKFEIVIIKYEPTSFTTPVYSIYVVPFGTKYSEKNEEFKFENYRSPSFSMKDISWESDSEIIIRRNSISRVYNFMPEYYYPLEFKKDKSQIEYKKIKLELKNY